MKAKFKDTEIGKIPVDWEKKTLGEMVTFQRGYDLPLKNIKSGRYPVVKSNGIAGYHNEFKAKGPGVTIGRSGKIGDPFFIKSDYWPHNTTLFSKKFHNSNPKFVYYFLKGLSLNRFNAGSAVPTLNRNHIHPILITIPKNIEEQHRIAKILSDLDSKIELLQRQNKTLEAIAQTLFKHWFVDFEFPNEEGEPYKSSGGEMVDSELGVIPKGWEVGKLGDFINITSGKRPEQKSEVKDSVFNVPLVGASRVMGFVMVHLFKEPVLIIGRVGTHGVVQRFTTPTYPSDNTLVIRSPFYEYVYQVLKRIDYASLNVGSTQPLITQSSIKNYSIIISEKNIRINFENTVSVLFAKRNANNLEIENLSQIRDTLHPKLMSGEVRINK